MKRSLGAQISHALKDRGVDVIFGIPGVHNVEMYRGIEEAGITHVLARHEQGAGFMADGYARATGKPGVAYVITGPGLCNIMTPMGQAYSDSVPMLVMSSCLERRDRSMARGRLHEMIDQEAAAACVCDWSVTAPDADGAYYLIDKALGEFSSERPRPKHIQVPIDMLSAMADPAPSPAPLPATLSPALDVGEIAGALKAAKRPIFVLGGGAVYASEPLRALVSASGAAIFSTYAGRGVIASDYPLNYGAYLARPESLGVLELADLAIVIGSELSETDLWREELGTTCDLVRVDIDGRSLLDRNRARWAVKADAAAFAVAMLAEMQGHTEETAWRAEDCARSQVQFRASTEAVRPQIARFGDAMRRALPDDALIYSDMTQIAYVTKETVPMDAPGLWHHPFGFGTLGYALPAAIGGKIGQPDRAVVAMAGDYGFHYTMQELGVAVELGLSLPIILWDNAKLMEIEASMVESQIAPNAVVAKNPDFCALAKAFGAATVAPPDLDAFEEEIKRALARKGPTLIYITPQTKD